MIEITCIECGNKFNKFTGDMDERTCLTCVLKEEDPDVIKEDNFALDGIGAPQLNKARKRLKEEP
jgi:hypothetical protein